MIGGVGGGGLSQQQIQAIGLSQEGNESLRGMLQMPGNSLGEKVLAFVKVLIAGTPGIGGGASSMMGGNQLAGLGGLGGMPGMSGGMPGANPMSQQMASPVGNFLGM